MVLSASAVVVASRDGNEFTVVVGNVGTQTVSVPLSLSELVDEDVTYGIHVYNSERDAWEDGGSQQRGIPSRSLAVSIESKGFRIITLSAL